MMPTTSRFHPALGKQAPPFRVTQFGHTDTPEERADKLAKFINTIKGHPQYWVFKDAVQRDRGSSSHLVEINQEKHLLWVEGKYPNFSIWLHAKTEGVSYGKVKLDEVYART